MDSFPWIEFGILSALAYLGILVLLPSSYQTVRAIGLPARAITRDAAKKFLGAPVAVLLGLWAGQPRGLGAPLLEAVLAGQAPDRATLASVARPAAVIGVGLGVVVLVFNICSLAVNRYRVGLTPFGTVLGVAVNRATYVQVTRSLGFFTVGAWLLGLVWHMPDGHLSPAALWTVTGVLAVLFVIGEAVLASRVESLRGDQSGRVSYVFFAMISIATSVAFSYLYWHAGLEAAMLGHFCMAVFQMLVSVSAKGRQPEFRL